MLPVSILLLLVFPAALSVAAHGALDLQGFTFPGGSASFDPTGSYYTRETEELNRRAGHQFSPLYLTKYLHRIQLCPVIANNAPVVMVKDINLVCTLVTYCIE